MTTPDDGERLTAHALLVQDPVLAVMIEAQGMPNPYVWNDGGRTSDSNFAAMVLHIIGQQISVAVAFTIYDRLAAATGSIPRVDSVIALGPDRLRGLGLSRAKVRYILDLAFRVEAEQLDIEHMGALSDQEAIGALTAVTGIGLWSAEMFLIHQLHRPDVLPAGDIGVRRAIAHAWSLDQPPAVDRVRQRGQAWAPYRSYATALLWRSLRQGAPS